MSLRVNSQAPLTAPQAKPVAAPASQAKAIAGDSYITTKPGNTPSASDHKWKTFGIVGLTIGGLSIAGVIGGVIALVRWLRPLGQIAI